MCDCKYLQLVWVWHFPGKRCEHTIVATIIVSSMFHFRRTLHFEPMRIKTKRTVRVIPIHWEVEQLALFLSSVYRYRSQTSPNGLSRVLVPWPRENNKKFNDLTAAILTTGPSFSSDAVTCRLMIAAIGCRNIVKATFWDFRAQGVWSGILWDT